MARIILITGGSRSGKSAHAQKMAEALPGPHAYVATCPVADPEMAIRVEKHRQARGAAWETIEEAVDLAGVVRRAAEYPVLLIDCLTLWNNNLFSGAEERGESFTEEAMADRCREVIEACRMHPGVVIFVTNEIGMGIVPADETTRRFRDCAGRCNQLFAAAADTVMLVVSGIPLMLKESAPSPARDSGKPAGEWRTAGARK